MGKLNFYTADLDYITFLKQEEEKVRGFSRVPNMEYGNSRKPKFLCGVVLQIHDLNYYVPVTSFKQQMPDNFLIRANNGQVTSSLRFNYMFPIPQSLVTERRISTEQDRAYRSLLAQELRYCISHQADIQHLAERTYRRVLLGMNRGLVVNSCDFPLLEGKCREYQLNLEKSLVKTTDPQDKLPMQNRIAAAQAEADWRNGTATAPQHKQDHER